MKGIKDILEFGTSAEKIKTLEKLDDENEPAILKSIISKLDDEDIRVRGEAFCALILNKNKISDILIDNLSSTNTNIRGFVPLVLANRNEMGSISEMIKMAKDERSMVRACVIGALGHLKAQDAKGIFLESLFDENLEVRKSAIQALLNLNAKISEEKIKDIKTENDAEIKRLLERIKE